MPRPARKRSGAQGPPQSRSVSVPFLTHGTRMTATYTVLAEDVTGEPAVFFVQCAATVHSVPFVVVAPA